MPGQAIDARSLMNYKLKSTNSQQYFPPVEHISQRMFSFRMPSGRLDSLTTVAYGTVIQHARMRERSYQDYHNDSYHSPQKPVSGKLNTQKISRGIVLKRSSSNCLSKGRE